MYNIRPTTKFQKDLKRVKKRPFKVDCRYRCPSKTNGIAPSGTSAMLFNENKAKKKQTKQNIFFITESIFQHLSLNGPI